MVHKVLIVDDSKLARMSMIRALKALQPDWDIEEASNADDAFARLKESLPNFVLMDFNMPGKDGITLAAEFREFDSSVSVAVISANHQVEVINRAMAAGAFFIPKPLTEKALADFLETTAQQRNATSK